MQGPDDEKIDVENVNVPGSVSRVNKAKYLTMKSAMQKILPAQAPGLTQMEIRDQVIQHLDPDLFPGGQKAGWWAKTVQLDMEAKNQLIRQKTKPLRWHKP